MRSKLLPRSLDNITPLQRTRIEEPTLLVRLPLPLLVVFGFALYASLVLDSPGDFALFVFLSLGFNLIVESSHICRTQDPRLRQNIPPMLRHARPKDNFLIRVLDEEDALEFELPFSELGDRAFDFKNGADADGLVVDC